MLSKIRKSNLKNKIHANGNDDAADPPLLLNEIVPSDKDDKGMFDDSQHDKNKKIIDQHIENNNSSKRNSRSVSNGKKDTQKSGKNSDKRSSRSLLKKSNYQENDSEQPKKDQLKRASTFGRFSTQMQQFFANMRNQNQFDCESSDDSTDTDSIDAERIVPVNPMQTLLGTVSNNAYVSWTHLSKIIRALEVVNSDLDVNTPQMNKIMIEQCLKLLKDSPYILKSKKMIHYNINLLNFIKNLN
jgi:hypothetical protein